jgi:hypothetical protein
MPAMQTLLKNVRALYEFVLLLVEFQLVYKRLGPDSSSVMTGFVLESFSGRVLVVQEVLRMRNLIWGISPCPRWSKLLI